LCKTYRTTPNSEFIRSISKNELMWMYFHWLQDREDEISKLEYLAGIINPDFGKYLRSKQTEETYEVVNEDQLTEFNIEEK